MSRHSTICVALKNTLQRREASGPGLRATDGVVDDKGTLRGRISLRKSAVYLPPVDHNERWAPHLCQRLWPKGFPNPCSALTARFARRHSFASGRAGPPCPSHSSSDEPHGSVIRGGDSQ